VDPVLLLRREEVVDEQLDRLGHVPAARRALVVELVRELERVPVGDGLEELDVPDDLVVGGGDHQQPLLLLPEPALGELLAERRLGEHAEREERAAVRDVGVSLPERVQVALADGAQDDVSALQHERPEYLTASAGPRAILGR
jgi:hypothetical protein